ncbi:hypothetical protein L6E12_06625 [Actinokineospora sp. PR83]|uniref:hypothetical protein n=1 Tax=Actinokineospora sp. PR83 TaxID=2884908 RepID=UPI001F165792|nr:hypothetical protein [Actinokineospora sp. PR83]MCG8915459.1 hypothetical protein [Actinokineospora sp. PR83]
MTQLSVLPEPEVSRARPAAVTGAFCGALLGAGITGVMLVLSTRSPGLLGLGAALSALAAAACAHPLREGRGWARSGLVAAALLGALCAPAAANPVPGPTAPFLGGAAVVVWVFVVTLLLRVDAGTFFARRS